jgi:predicted glutamine amidotransferase
MCGLSGFNGNTPNTLILRVLGTLNQSRGKHSCGVAYNEEIIKGIGEYENLFKNKHLVLKKAKTVKTVIQHNRFATKGFINEDNAHPFKIPLKNGRTIVFTHNGTLINEKELLLDFNVTENFDVDSKLLGYLIGNYGSKALEKYLGAAACAWYFTDSPDTLYLYKGASKRNKNSTEITTERPLHFCHKSKNNLYYSSEYDHLLFATDCRVKVYSLIENHICTFKNGECIKVTKVNRRKDAYMENIIEPIIYKKENTALIDTTSTASYFKNTLPPAYIQKQHNVGYSEIYYYGGRLYSRHMSITGIIMYNPNTNKLEHLDDTTEIDIFDEDYNLFYVKDGIILKNKKEYDSVKLYPWLVVKDSNESKINSQYLYIKKEIINGKTSDIYYLNKKKYTGDYLIPGVNIILGIHEGELIESSVLTNAELSNFNINYDLDFLNIEDSDKDAFLDDFNFLSEIVSEFIEMYSAKDLENYTGMPEPESAYIFENLLNIEETLCTKE